jgi:hypothetical protein
LLYDTSLSHREVSERTGRPLQTVARRRQQLGIQSVKVNRDWTPAETAQLWDMSLSLREIADQLGRTYGACKRKSDLLGIRREGTRRPRAVQRPTSYVLPGRSAAYSSEEDALLRELNWQVPLALMAQALGRSEASVGKRLHRLGLRDGFPTGDQHHWWKDGASQNPAYGWRGEDWAEVRVAVFDRDGYTCQDGGEFIPSGRGLVAHHIIPWRLRPVNDLRWLATLCVSHHMRRPEHMWTEIPGYVLAQLELEGRRLEGGDLSV